MNRIITLLSGCLLGLWLAGGCSRGGDETSGKAVDSKGVKSEASVKSVQKPVVAGPVAKQKPAIQPAVEPPPQPRKQVVVPPKPGIRITALMKRGDAPPRVGIVQDSTGSWRILREGDSFLGYRVDKINYNEGTVYLNWYGETVTLTVKGVKVKKTRIADKPVGKGPAASQGSKVTEAKLVIEGIHYEPTAAERALGIDPHDAATWPEGYRGPAIERIAAEMGEDAEVSPPMMPPPGVAAQKKFQPTPREIAQGIDPNDSSTWPEGYRGPGIERMAAELEKEGIKPDNNPMPEIPPPNGTPEEIKARFFEKYAPKGSAKQASKMPQK